MASESNTSLAIRHENENIISSVMQRCGIPVTAAHLAKHVADECEEGVLARVLPIVQDFLVVGTENGSVRKVGRKYESATNGNGADGMERTELAKTAQISEPKRRTTRSGATNASSQSSGDEQQHGDSPSKQRNARAGQRKRRSAASRSRSRAKATRSRSRSTRRKAAGKRSAKSPAK